jgi:membrane-associated phospholipid phosphatase
MIMKGQTSEASAGWGAELRRRFGILWFLKMIGTVAVLTLFFVAYFWVLRHPARAVTVMPTPFVDDCIGFVPMALPLYLSLWVYVGLLPAFYKNLRELLHYVAGVFGLSLVGLGIFYRWPTAVAMVETDRGQAGWYAFLKRMDESGNACPSLHVAFAVFTAIGFHHLLREVNAGRIAFLVNILWSAGICYSTIAIRQHVFLDLVAGTLLGALAGMIVFAERWPVWRKTGEKSAT